MPEAKIWRSYRVLKNNTEFVLLFYTRTIFKSSAHLSHVFLLSSSSNRCALSKLFVLILLCIWTKFGHATRCIVMHYCAINKQPITNEPIEHSLVIKDVYSPGYNQQIKCTRTCTSKRSHWHAHLYTSTSRPFYDQRAKSFAAFSLGFNWKLCYN